MRADSRTASTDASLAVTLTVKLRGSSARERLARYGRPAFEPSSPKKPPNHPLFPQPEMDKATATTGRILTICIMVVLASLLPSIRQRPRHLKPSRSISTLYASRACQLRKPRETNRRTTAVAVQAFFEINPLKAWQRSQSAALPPASLEQTQVNPALRPLTRTSSRNRSIHNRFGGTVRQSSMVVPDRLSAAQHPVASRARRARATSSKTRQLQTQAKGKCIT